MNVILPRSALNRVTPIGHAIAHESHKVITPPVLFYSYIRPALGIAPASGEIVHADNLLNKLAVSWLDINDVDVSASIGQITTGDFIDIGGKVYQVIAPTFADTGFSYITVSPEEQKQPGVYQVRAWR
jgi:hypothetical protein